MLRQYLLLIRVPNLFTVPSNIMSGYFALTPANNADLGQLISLIISSVFLYISGIVLNDYFDIEVDRKERPNRPLVSGRITKRSALIIAGASIIAANILAFLVSWASLVVSASLTAVIIAYNYRLKRNAVSNPLTMASARFLNVVLGGSSALDLSLIMHQTHMVLVLVFVGISLFLYTAAISVLSRKEIADPENPSLRSSWVAIAISISIVFVLIALILVIGLLAYFQIGFILNLLIFSSLMTITFLRLIFKIRILTKPIERIENEQQYDVSMADQKGRNKSYWKAALEIQNTIKIMVLSIVLLDSIFLSGLVGIHYGMATLLLVIPPIYLGRKLYVT
jgi:heme O synthase-like polyprenyltransferase